MYYKQAIYTLKHIAHALLCIVTKKNIVSNICWWFV